MTAPIIILHRRNYSEQISDLPRGGWIEIDVDCLDGMACVSHDPATKEAMPEPLSVFIPRALEKGVAGFVFDCKRENVEKAVQPIIARYGITNYFYLNEMEIQGDICLARDAAHRTALRIWRYRPARDLIRYAEEMKAASQPAPGWAWIDCWQRELAADIGKPFLPINQADAHRLQRLGVKLCVCSPELYMHNYEKTYEPIDLENIYRSVVRYRQRLMQTGVATDAVCTKFPRLWMLDADELLASENLNVV